MTSRPPSFPVQVISDALQGRFRIQTVIRAGAQGAVYHALRLRTPDNNESADDIALKIYFDPAEDARVQREIDAMERMRHPALADLIEHGELTIVSERYRYVVWEYIPGEPLDITIGRGPVSPLVVASIARDVATALQQIWRHKIVHRDVSPKNIMLRPGDSEAVLIDLGLARHVSREAITSVGSTWGTRGYMSPEQTRAERQLTCKSDVFSLGVVLQHALAGRHPTAGDQDALITARVPTAAIAPSTPIPMALLIDNMLESRPAFRPQPVDVASRFRAVAEQLVTNG